jgi:large subunit ribosomal protein L15
MKLHELHPPRGSRHARKRIGRGISAGQGKTSGRGQKGAGSRQGSKVPRAFEGGQMKITMRLPKLRGFANRWRVEYTVVNLSKLNRFPSGAIVDGAALAQEGLVGSAGERVKLLAAGRVRVALTVRVHRASAAAVRAVEAAGGRVELLETRPERVEAGAGEPVAAPTAVEAEPAE